MILLTAVETYDRVFGIDWQTLADSVLTLIAVFALFAVMSYFLFEPARKMLNERKEKIRKELESARTDMEQASEMKAEYEKKLKNVDREAEAILSEARRKGLANENMIVAEAKEEAHRILNRARVEVDLEKQKMSDDIKNEIINVAAAMAERVVGNSMDAEMDDRLLNETLNELGEDTWLK